MAEDNPIEGLDPNQSAFEPILDMMDQNRPEDLSRTTTTTTLYISGDPTSIEEMSMDSTTTMPPVQPEDIVAQFRQLNSDIKVGDVDRIIPNATNEERLQIMFDYPEQFSADIAYNNKINSYVTQLKEQGYKDDQILSYLEQEKEGKRSDLMSKFPDLFDVKSIKRKGDVLNILESNKLSYSKLSKFGSEGQLKKEYPEFSNLIDQKKKDQQIQKDIKAQQKKVESDLDIKIKDLEKQLETGKNFIGQDMSPIDQETARRELRKLKGEQNLSDFDSYIPESAPISRRDIGKASYSEPVTDFEFKRIDEFSVEPIVTDYRFVDKEQVDQELVFLSELNKNISATGGTSLSDQQINDVYVTGIKPYKESFKDYDDQLWRSVSGVVSVSPVVDLNDEFFERHGTTRDEFINKRKLILSSGIFDTNKLGETYYTEEEFQAMYDRSAKKINNQFGFQASIAYEKITGTNLAENPEEFYNESRKSSGLYNSAIDEDIVSGDSKATADNLRKRFGWLPYGSKDEAQNYLETEGFRFSYDGDNLIIQTTVTPEGKTTPELLNGIEINTNSDNLSGRIKNFMSKAIVTEDVRSTILEYERGEGRFNAEYNDPMRAAMAMSSYILSKPNVFGDANGFATDGYGQGFLFGLMPMGGGKDKSAFMRDMSVINTLINGLKAKDPIYNKYTIDDLNKKIQYAQYIEDQKAPELIGLKGHALAALSGVTETLSGVTEGTLDLVIDIPFLPVSNSLSDREVNMLKESELEEYQISDIQNKRIKDEVEYGIDEWLKNTTAVTDKSLADAGLTYELLKTMIHSLSTGAIVGFNPALVPVAFGLQTTARVENELKDSDLSNFEKRIISWPMATFEGILEQRGLQSVLGPGKSKLFRWAAAKALKGLPKNASLYAIEASMKYTLKGLSIKTILGILEGASYEALTEVGQEAVEFTEKNIVNMILGKDVFKNMPDITTKKGADEFLSQLGKAALLGGLSGGGMSAIGGTTNLLVNGFQLKGLNKSFENQYNVITSEEGRAIALSQINLAYQSKQITKEDAEARIKAMNEAYPLMMEIPTELSSGQKRQAYDLMLERKALEGEVKDKDKNLVVKQTDRIAEINNQLQQISKTDAIQEQETDEKVLPDEQPKMELQEVEQGDTKDQQEEISPENSSNYANLTEDQEGNVVFFHRGQKGYETVKPSSGKTRATSREEAAAVGKVGGVAMYYTDQNDAETAVSGDSQYAVKVPKSKVYDANTDSKNLKEEAKKRHEEENPGKAFDANTELAYVTKIAGEQGYQMVVAQWDGKTRAQTTQELTPTDVQEVDGNTVTKSFNEKYESNKDKGFVPVIPVTQEEGLTGVYEKIRSERGSTQTYDELYSMVEGRTRDKYSQEQVTKMVNESDLSQEIKDEYNAIIKAKPESRRSDKTRDNIAGVEVKYPTTEQTAERKAERTKPEYVDNAASQNEQEDVESFQKELEGEFGMLTGENPLGKPLTEEENRQLNEKAEEWLNKKGYKPRRITGKYGQAENSFFVPGLTKQDAIAFAKEFNQESVAHSEGMIYQNGKMNPRKKSDDNFKMEQYSPESDFVSVVNTKDGLKTFTVGYDFKKEEDSTPKPKKKAAPKKEAKGIRRQIENARKAIAKILPGVEIVVHETEDSYRKATDETDSKKQASRGEYNNKTKKIHINVSKANNRTVAHEVFHAILLSKVKTDQAAKDLTERMIKALSKNLEGMPEVKEALDAFAANYDENIQSEEKLAELVGILAGNYAQMNKPSQNLIKRFLDRLAKMFGLKPFTDNEVVDVLNTIAGKVAVGEEIADVDLKIIPKNKTAEIKESNKRFQADFTDLKSGVTYSFDKNTNEFKKIEQKYITRNKSISDFNNVFMILHQPDSAFSGKISKKLSDGSEILVEGKGGIFYPIKFHEKGYFWASTSKAAEAMAESMNKAINKDGKIYMALTTAPTNKVLSSTNAANGVMNLFISLSKNPKFKITGIESILIKSYNKAFGDKIDSSNNLDEIVKIIEEKLGAEKSSFDDRRTFSTSIIDSVVKSIQRKISNQDAQNSLADFFGEGMMAEDLVTKFKKGSKISKANLTEAVSQMLTEPMLRDGKSKTENGSIYAILEIDGEVEAVDAKSETDHESYPKAIKSKGDSKTTLHLLTDRVKWNNVTIDPATGKTVNKSGKVKSKDPKKKGTLVERWTQIMSPSAGITTQGVKIDTSEVTTPDKRKQKVGGLLSKNIDVTDDSNRKGLVPVEQLKGFIGEDRVGDAEMTNSRETIDKLKEDIKENGFKQPIVVVYDKFSDKGEASIIEGNHRIQAAIELGLKEVPVKFKKGTLRTNEQREADGMFPLNRKTVGEIDTRFGVDGTKLGLEVRQPTETDIVTKSAKKKPTTQRKQKDDGPVEPRIDIRDLKKKSDKKVKDTNKGKGPILRRLRRSLFDRQNDIKRVIKDFVPNPKKVSKIINAIVTKAGASGYANEIFTQQDEKIFKKKNRLGKMVNLSAEEMTNLEAIIYARRIVAINENRRERGMNPYTGMDGLTEQDAIDNLNMMESLVGKKEFDSLSERAEDYFEAFKNNLKMLRDSGRITEETYNNLKDVEYSPIKTLKYIIPQDTMTDEDINNAVSTLGVNKKDIMKLSDMNENEILFDARFLLMMNTNIVVRRSFENKMLNEFSQGYESIDKAGKEALSDFIIEGPVKKVPPGFRKVEYFQDGVKKDLIMREDYARQLLDIKNQNNFLKGLGKMTGANILRFFATGGNPLFIVGNTAVDFANIAFFSDVYSAIKPLATVQLAYDFVKNFLRKASKTNSYENIKMEFMEHGGAMDFLSTDGLRMVQEMKLKNKILNKAQKALSAYARFMSYIGETGEMSFRLAVYERVKKAEIKKFEKENDRSPNQQEMEDIMFEAAAQSRETIDFSQGGTWVKQMDQALPYFNAAMQGLRRPLDYARKNPVGFTSSVVQYAVMAAGMTATSLGTLLRAIGDDDEEKKKLQDILDSISEYEKASYHIIFTGNKDKDGNYEYVRIKKLPLLSILGTATEQYTTKYLLKSQGIDYKTDDKSIKKSIEMSAPLDVLGPIVGDESVGQALGGVVKRNPLAAAWLTYTYNEDTFTGEKVFYEPRDKKVKPYAEGLYDDKVNDIYKIIAPALDMSPKRSQAAVEKIITSESTNPSISIFYALTNGLFDTNADEFKENSDTFDNGMGHFLDVVSKKMVRYTNKNILRYKDQDKIEELEKRIDTDAYLTKIKIKKDIDKNVDSEILRNGDYNSKEYQKELEKLEGILDKSDVNTKDRPYYGSYTVRKDLKGQEVFKEVTDIIYERSPKMMAARLYSRYGDSLDKDELKELSQSFKLAKASNNVLKEGYQIYYKNNYLNKSQEEIDKFEETFGKIR